MNLEATPLSDFSLIENERISCNQLLKSLGLRTHAAIRRDFSGIPAPVLEEYVGSVQRLRRSLVAAQEECRDLRDTQYLADFTLKELGLTASQEFFDTLDPDDLVEGYTLEQRQFFRNFQFMEICGYDLFDLLTYDWMTLYERTHMISEEILRRLDKDVFGMGRTISLMDLPSHYMKEKLSEKKQVSKVKFRHIGPVYSAPGQPAGFLVSTKAHIIDESPLRHELRFI